MYLSVLSLESATVCGSTHERVCKFPGCFYMHTIPDISGKDNTYQPNTNVLDLVSLIVMPREILVPMILHQCIPIHMYITIYVTHNSVKSKMVFEYSSLLQGRYRFVLLLHNLY